MRWIRVIGLVWIPLLSQAACGDGDALDVPAQRDEGSASRDLPEDRVVECHEAPAGTACGTGPGMHCLFGGCVRNACGDGIRAGNEGCDDGNEWDGDGCSARCKAEVCGDGSVDLGEDCDDGNEDDEDTCNNACELQDPSQTGEAGGAPDAGGGGSGGRSCPAVSGILAEPVQTQVCSDILLEGVTTASAGVSHLWFGAGGSFASDTSIRTTFTCEKVGEHRLSFVVAKRDCLSNARTITVECTPGPVMPNGEPADCLSVRDAGVGGGLDAGADGAGS